MACAGPKSPLSVSLPLYHTVLPPPLLPVPFHSHTDRGRDVERSSTRRGQPIRPSNLQPAEVGDTLLGKKGLYLNISPLYWYVLEESMQCIQMRNVISVSPSGLHSLSPKESLELLDLRAIMSALSRPHSVSE